MYKNTLHIYSIAIKGQLIYLFCSGKKHKWLLVAHVFFLRSDDLLSVSPQDFKLDSSRIFTQLITQTQLLTSTSGTQQVFIWEKMHIKIYVWFWLFCFIWVVSEERVNADPVNPTQPKAEPFNHLFLNESCPCNKILLFLLIWFFSSSLKIVQINNDNLITQMES